MIICPDCQSELSTIENLRCQSCSWMGKDFGSIKSYMSSADQKDPTFQSYSENYDLIAEEDLHASIQSQRYIQIQSEIFMNLVNYKPNDHFCEIGVGQGYLLKEMFKKNIKNITAVDIALPYLKKFDDQRIKLIQANAENLPFKNEFDVITTTDVLEHVLNVGSFLYCVNRALKMGGHLYLRVPYREDLLGYSPFYGCKYKFVHLRSFDKQILQDYMKYAGFEVEKIQLDGFHKVYPQPYWNSTPKRLQRYHKLMNTLTKNMEHPEDVNKWNNRFSNLLMRPFEIVVCARKINQLQG
jgi:ubiquinone/menaquinone biosynthesis C-methylase UbiE